MTPSKAGIGAIAAAIATGCGSGLNGYGKIVTRLDTSADSYEVAQESGPLERFLALAGEVVGIPQAWAKRKNPVPSVTPGRSSISYFFGGEKKAPQDCFDLDEVGLHDNGQTFAFLNPIFSTTSIYPKIQVGQSVLIYGSAMSGNNTTPSGKGHCYYTGMAMVADWNMSFVGGTCAYATLTRGRDGEAIVTGTADSSGATCRVQASFRDKTGTKSAQNEWYFEVVPASPGSEPAFQSITVDGKEVRIGGKTEVDFSKGRLEFKVDSAAADPTQIFWGASTGLFGSSNSQVNTTWSWITPGRGGGQATILLSILAPSPNRYINQAKFLVVE